MKVIGDKQYEKSDIELQHRTVEEYLPEDDVFCIHSIRLTPKSGKEYLALTRQEQNELNNFKRRYLINGYIFIEGRKEYKIEKLEDHEDIYLSKESCFE